MKSLRPSHSLVSVCLLGGGLLLLSGCASQSDVNALQSRIRMQEQQIAMLSNMQPAQADTWAQVQQLRQEMAAVKGEIDNFNNAAAASGGLTGLVDRVNRHHQALQAIGTQFAMDLQLDPTANPLPGAGTPGIPGVPVPVTSAQPAQPGVPPAITPQPAQPAQPVPQPAPQAVNQDTATVLYESGVNSFNSRKYKEALNAFTDFTTTYPKNKLISNAWFWKGESNFALGQYSAAALDYEKVISQYPKSAKAPSCYLKQAISFQRIGNKDAAKVRLNELVKKFPKAAEATRAKQLLKSM
ncbi:MAG TPA: tol-pal system protein YbgF [Candidatus Avidesulfovibrio excrementigallinarum]|nr:tol-pal system protein YbgF [Candidatus Avidesulfovibrio excrementigallinarum]